MILSSQTYKAFVSSTFVDLKNHREHVIRSLRRAGFVVDPMEDWTADVDEPQKFSQARLDGCDLCVLLVGFRRGLIPDGGTRSITQLEYDAAMKQKIDVVPFVLAEDTPWLRKFDELEKDLGVKVWREELLKRHVVEFFSLDPRSIDLTGALGRWLAKKGVRSGRTRTLPIDWPEGKSPYPGLEWFDKEYAPLFFGRDREVNDLVNKMSEPGGRVLLVNGGSGSGKSSVIAAGVWRAIIKEGRLPGSAQWKWHRIQPSDGEVTPFDSLALGLKQVLQLSSRPQFPKAGAILQDLLQRHLNQGQELILFIDQLEELFTVGYNESDIKSFLEQLICTAQDKANRLRVLGAIRSEFIGKLEAFESTLNLLNTNCAYYIGSVLPMALHDMIEKPALATEYEFEPHLIDRMLSDAGQEPGNLPLVAYALKQLFERRRGRVFTLEAYNDIGGVVGAIAKKANEVLSGLTEEVRGAFDSVFSKLVHLERERPPTGSSAILSSFGSDQAAVQLIEALARHDCRVLITSTIGQETIVEVSHAKLFSAWPELKNWIYNSGDDLRLIDYEEEVARRWHETGCPLHEVWRQDRAKKAQRALTRFNKKPSNQLQVLLCPQPMLVTRLEDRALSHDDRLLIGKILAEFGDTRPGVGLKYGLPDIVWIDVPGGEVKLNGIEHVFTVRPFRIAKYPVTNMQFEAFIQAEDGYRNLEWWNDIGQSHEAVEPGWREVNAPRENVTWYEAISFCRWLSAKTGTTIRLPTEWEWQQAARGGDANREYPWEGVWDEFRCNSNKSRLNRTTAVGMYPHGATQHGALDIAGNVWEWCLNDYDAPVQPEAVSVNQMHDWRVVRGGSWYDRHADLRAVHRFGGIVDSRNTDIGFRLIQQIEL